MSISTPKLSYSGSPLVEAFARCFLSYFFLPIRVPALPFQTMGEPLVVLGVTRVLNFPTGHYLASLGSVEFLMLLAARHRDLGSFPRSVSLPPFRPVFLRASGRARNLFFPDLKRRSSASFLDALGPAQVP